MAGSDTLPVLLYAHPSMAKLAKEIVERTGHVTDSQSKRLKVERAVSLSRQRAVEYRDDIKWETFNDGFPNLFISDVKTMAGRDVIFLGSFHSPAVIFEQLGVLYAFPSCRIQRTAVMVESIIHLQCRTVHYRGL